MRNERLGGALLIIIGLALIVGSFFTLNQPLFASRFPLFWGIIAIGFCACSIGFSQIRARILAMPFITGTVICAGMFFARIIMFVLF